MTRLLLLTSLMASAALADIPPSNSTQCAGSAAGAACTTDDGRAGTCVSSMVTRLDYSKGVPPGTKQVEMLLCVASAPAASASKVAPPILAGGVVVLAIAGLLIVRVVTRNRRSAAA